jgi:streptogramin lyase
MPTLSLSNTSRNVLEATACLITLACLSGCGMTSTSLVKATTSTPPHTPAKISMHGKVHGGEQPISGATIQLYAIGTGAGVTASQPLLSPSASTDDSGAFNVTGTYLCPQYGSETYFVATGGNPGLAPGLTNQAISLMTATGPCTTPAYDGDGNLIGYTLDPNLMLDIDEVTTVASVYALAPFMHDYADISDGGNPVGAANAFNMVNMLIDITQGLSPGPALSPAVTYSAGTGFPTVINTIADALSVCVNSTGTDANCGNLFSLTTTASGTAADTIAAALAIATHPSIDPNALFNTVTPIPAFQPVLVTPPNDWTIALNYTGLGLSTPHGIAVDSLGNLWIANQTSNYITEIYSGGDSINTPGTSTQYTGGGILGAQALAVDSSNNIWIANTAGNSIVELDDLGNVLSGTGYTAGGINGPVAIAIDTLGDAWVANFNGNSLTQLHSDGTPSSFSPITQAYGSFTVSMPTGIAIDSNNMVWVSNSGLQNSINSPPSLSSQVQHFDQNGVAQFLFSFYIAEPLGMAVDASNNVWVASNGTSLVKGFNFYGGSLWGPGVGGGISQPAGVAIDGTGNIWVTNSTTIGSLSELTAATGVPQSPSTGFGTLNAPLGVAIDLSGNLWTANSGDNSITQFVGLATPVNTPVVANTIAPLHARSRASQ